MKRIEEEIPERQQILDDICYRIFRMMLYNLKISESGIRYNQLYRLLKGHFSISKPTFNDHLGHLKDKKYVISKKEEKQKVRLFLNFNHPAVSGSKKAKEEFLDNIQRLRVLIDDKDYMDKLPILLAKTAVINSLNQMRLSVLYSMLPETSAKKNLVFESTLISQAIFAEEQQFIAMLLDVSLKKGKIDTPEKALKISDKIQEAIDLEKKEIAQAVQSIIEKNPSLL